MRFAHIEVYAAAARARGMDFSAYVNAVMAEYHGLVDADSSTAGGQLVLSDTRSEDAA